MWPRLACALFFLFALGARAADYDGYSVYDLAYDPDSANALDFKTLKGIVGDKSVTTFEELLTALQETKQVLGPLGGHEPRLKYVPPQFFTHVVKMFHSESSQQTDVTEKAPRLLLHSDRLFFGTTAHAGKNSERSLEMIEFDPVLEKWRFREIVFNGRGKTPTIVEDSTRCYRCHLGRPIWTAYEIWPGAFGGLRDYLSLLGRPDHKTTTVPLREADWYQQLYDQPEMKDLAKWLPQAPRMRSERRDNYYIREEKTHPNFTFGAYLSQLNFRTMAREIKDADPKQHYRFAIAAAFLNCDDIESYLPEALRAQHQRLAGRTVAQLIADTAQVNTAEQERRIKEYETLNGVTLDRDEFSELLQDFPRTSSQVTGKARFVLEPLGIDLKRWSMSRGPEAKSYSYEFSTGMESTDVGITHFANRELMPALEKERPTLKGMAKLGVAESAKPPLNAKYCAELKPLSLAALAAVPLPRTNRPPLGQPGLRWRDFLSDPSTH